MRKTKVTIAFLTFFCLPVYSAEVPHDLTLGEALTRAEKVSPELKAAQARETQGRGTVKILSSFYYPSLDFQVDDSWGYTGSNSALGTAGLMSSPFRVGPGAGLVSKLSLLDPARLYAVRTARSNVKVLEERTQITRFQADQTVLQVYFDAARYRAQAEAWQTVSEQISRTAQDVDRFVKTGQHSPVERFLVQDQSEEAAMGYEAAEEEYRVTLRRLAFLTGLDEKTIACPASGTLTEESLSIIRPGLESPLLARAIADAAAAHAGVAEHSAQNYPKFVALASVGDVSRSAANVEKKDYSGGLGFLLPLFEGGQISGEIERAKALAAEKDQEVEASRLELDDLNARYDEIIGASRVKLRHLQTEWDVDRKALQLAKERYLSFIGPLIEVREAIRNLARNETQQSDVRADLLLATGSKALLNGGRVEQSGKF